MSLRFYTHQDESRCLSSSAWTNLHISYPHRGESPESCRDLAAATSSFISETSLMGPTHICRWRWRHLCVIPSSSSSSWSRDRVTDIRSDLLPGRVRPDREKRCSVQNESMLFVCSGNCLLWQWRGQGSLTFYCVSVNRRFQCNLQCPLVDNCDSSSRPCGFQALMFSFFFVFVNHNFFQL